MSDEIICKECGRPNMPEAVKCWYCQSLLKIDQGESTAKLENDLGVEITDDEATSSDMVHEEMNDKNESEENIPDWLKRIRELKKADQPEEEELDQWRQQILFNEKKEELSAETKQKPKSQTKATKEDKPFPSTLRKEHAAPKKGGLKPKASIDEKEEEIKLENTSEEENDQLPEGFTPMDTEQG